MEFGVSVFQFQHQRAYVVVDIPSCDGAPRMKKGLSCFFVGHLMIAYTETTCYLLTIVLPAALGNPKRCETSLLADRLETITGVAAVTMITKWKYYHACTGLPIIAINR